MNRKPSPLEQSMEQLKTAMDRLKDTRKAPAAGAGGWRDALQEATFTLAILRVSAERLAQLTDRAEVIEALDEILANVLGTECWVLYELDPGLQRLMPVTGRGPAVSEAVSVPLVGSALGARAATRAVSLGDGERSGESGALAAVVPLVHGGQLCGAVAIHAFLQHKPGQAAHDEEVLRLLVTAGGKALRHTSHPSAR